jgi:glycosyltransferase involved in cell wall biosynthesis
VEPWELREAATMTRVERAFSAGDPVEAGSLGDGPGFAVVRRADFAGLDSRPHRAGPTVTVVIPAKNEARNLPHVLANLPDGLHEVILVDGNSTDDTIGVARRHRPDIVVIGQTRKGKGNALACGFARATGDFVVMLDADGSTDPAEIPRFVDALRQGADFAKGSRFMPGAGSSDISRLRQMGNYWLNKIVNLLYGTRYTDLCYGYNAFRRDCIDVIDLDPGTDDDGDGSMLLWGDGFEVETLINVRIAKARLRVFEVPSFERNRVFGASNLNAFTDGIRVLRTIHIERTRGTRKAAVRSAALPRRAGTTWSRLSTVDDVVF